MNARPIPARIRATAAAWRARRDAGWSGQDAAEFAAWLQADPRHGEAFADVEETWNALARIGAFPPPGEPDADALSPAPVLAFEGPAPRKSRFKRLWSVGAAAAVAAGIAVLAWQQAPRWKPAPASSHIRDLNLADGSVIELNAQSDVAVQYSATERRVVLLRGEAHFVVAPNPERPFLVTVRDVTVRAVGTAFNVRWKPAVLEVLVTAGKVEVEDAKSGTSLLPAPASPGGNPEFPDRRLTAGQRAVISMQATATAPAAVSSLAADEAAQALAWRDARFEFADATLGEAAAMFNRRNHHQLVIADPALRNQRFGGTFRPDAYDAFVRLLESDFGVVAERRGDETILRPAR